MACASGGMADVASVPEQFPEGLRVLVVDDDVTCLKILERKLRRCMYKVTSCSQATVALNLLREQKGCFDLVLSDVHMPDMDGFKLLELVGLEMDLPVIMMSADGRTHLVMRGIRHGACDYLIKPIRDEELKNIWQHVIRKKWNEIKENDHSGSLADHDHQKLANDDAEYASSTCQGADELLKSQTKKRDSKDEDDTELDSDDLTTAKKPRVVWSVELHQQFVSAVNQLGIDKAVPKRILELMNVPGLTRENVASHLQKFRLYLKRLSGVPQQQVGLPSSYCGPMEQNLKLASFGRFDLQALAASGQLPPQTLAALHAEILSRPAENLVIPAMDQRTILQASFQGSKCSPTDRNVAFGQPLIKCVPNIAKQTSQPPMSNEEVFSEFTAWSSKSPGEIVPSCNLTPVVETNNNMLISFIQQQQQLKHPIMADSSRLLNVQPSCLVVPSESSPNFHAENSPASVNQSCSLRNSMLDYNNPSFQSNNSSNFRQALEMECKPGIVGSVSPSSRSMEGSTCQRAPSSPITTSTVMQGSGRTPIYHSKGASIPSRFAVNEHDLPMRNISQVKLYPENNRNKVKQEPNMDVAENINMGIPVRRHLCPNDPMSVFSD